ncbi:MAG: AbrB/MazE/SpoVT family DNA-binding domain-containing protein [Clostridia bacterium]|nr:AbrB/MazE/SpoVT family DNA-binding domain-containing protein [Clostridia bacterium]
MPKGKHVLSLPKGKYVFGTAKVGEKGQIVIPKEARQVFDIKPGDNLLIFGDENSGIVVTKTDVINDVAIKILEKTKE